MTLILTVHATIIDVKNVFLRFFILATFFNVFFKNFSWNVFTSMATIDHRPKHCSLLCIGHQSLASRRVVVDLLAASQHACHGGYRGQL